MASEGKYTFIVEWFDSAASLVRQYQLSFWPADNTVDMYDIKNRRTFLKRCEYPALKLADLFIGASVTVFSRMLKVVDYADLFTKGELERKRSKTFAMIKPDAYNQIGKIVDAIYRDGFVISKLKMVRLTPADAQEFYAEHQGKPFFNTLISFMTRDVVVAMELVADNAVQKWRSLIGPTNPENARREAPTSLRARFGSDGTQNAVHGSDSPASARRESDFFFGPGRQLQNPVVLNNCTCCVIKPHLVSAGQAGQVIDMVLEEGFEVSALEMFFMDRTSAEEFYEVYKGVLPEYPQLIESMLNGPVIAMEVRQENAVETFRQLCGPHDPEIARALRPNTIRARLGEDRVMNGVHCTDLPEDGQLEVEYFFRILQQS
eukprot:GILI01003054.1.p1 GENE.GILI01003054.1~~GILI01003054.1.p1  ORF type:complete len:376 (+),score=110.48 GILI01003054.1:153-1280(+)